MHKSSDSKVDAFFSKFTRLQYKKGEVILRAGDPPAGVLYLKKGFVRMSFMAESGDLLVLHIYKAGSFFPMSWVVNNTPNRYCFESLTPVEIARAPREEVLKFIKFHPDVMEHFLERFLSGVDGLLMRFEHLVFESAYQKTILLLLYFVKNFSDVHEKGRLSVPLTHKEIAAWIGTTRETASIQIEALKYKKLISYNKRFIVIPAIQTLEEELKIYKPS
jgi:CRP/FNR family transcriptional regulator, cyclic AMP receptor protein